MRFTGVPTGVGRQGKVRPSLTNEVEADTSFSVFEAFRFDSQVSFNRIWSILHFKLTLFYNHETVEQTCNTKSSACLGD